MNNEFFAKACGEWKDRLAEGKTLYIDNNNNRDHIKALYPIIY